MKEELKQAIESYYPEVDAFGYTRPNYSHFRKAAKDALLNPDFLLHADPEIMKQAGWVKEEEWISVEELTYPDHETIMVYSPDMPQYPLFGYFNSNNVFVCLYNMHLPKYYRITHWKPLPHPPKI